MPKSNPLENPIFIRHVLKFAVVSHESVQQADNPLLNESSSYHTLSSSKSPASPSSSLFCLIPFLQVSTDFRDTILDYGTGTLSTALLPKSRWSFIQLFYRVCEKSNSFMKQSLDKTFQLSLSANSGLSDSMLVSADLCSRQSKCILEVVIKSIMVPEWLTTGRRKGRALVKRLATNATETCLSRAVRAGNADLVEYLVETLKPNLDTECRFDRLRCTTVFEQIFTLNQVYRLSETSITSHIAVRIAKVLGDAYRELEARREEVLKKRPPRKSAKQLVQHVTIHRKTSPKKLDKDALIVSRYWKKNRTQPCLFDEPGILFQEGFYKRSSVTSRPLIQAVQSGNVELVKLFLERFHCDPRQLEDDDEAPLFTSPGFYSGSFIRTISVQMFRTILHNKGPYPRLRMYHVLNGRGRAASAFFPSLSFRILEEEAGLEGTRRFLTQYQNVVQSAACYFLMDPERETGSALRMKLMEQQQQESDYLCEILKLIFEEDKRRGKLEQLSSVVEFENFAKVCARGLLQVVRMIIEEINSVDASSAQALFDRIHQQSAECALACSKNVAPDILRYLLDQNLLSKEKILERQNEIIDAMLSQSNSALGVFSDADSTDQIAEQRLKIMRFLVEKCNVDLAKYVSPYNKNANDNLLHRLARPCFATDADSEHRLLRYVLSLGIIDVNKKNDTGSTPLAVCSTDQTSIHYRQNQTAMTRNRLGKRQLLIDEFGAKM